MVSVGPEQVTIPFLEGQDKDDAREDLEGRGLQVRLVERESSEPRDTVVGTDPVPGTLTVRVRSETRRL